MGIRGFERRLERMVEGAFARAFKSGLRPVELGRRLVREMDDNRSVGVRGGTVVPNAFVVAVSAEDLAQFEEVQDTLTRELGDAAREHARDEGYTFMGPVEVELVVDERLHEGAFHITGRMVCQWVSSPPEKSIKFKAVMPVNCASPALSKWIPPIPSDPASIPTTKKKISVGTPSRLLVLPAIMLINRRTDPISRIFPASKNIRNGFAYTNFI